jgi:hypothetical protein
MTNDLVRIFGLTIQKQHCRVFPAGKSRSFRLEIAPMTKMKDVHAALE